MEGDDDALEFRLLDGLVRVFEEHGDPSTPAHRAADWGAAHDGAQGHLVRLCQVTVPGDVDADIRLWQAEVWAAGLAGLYRQEVARLDIVYPGRRGMLRQELQVPFQMGPPFGVVPDPVAVALSRMRLAYGANNVSLGFRSALLSNGISELHFSPLLRGAPEVSGLLSSPEGPALDFREALLALGLSQRHEASFEGPPHCH